jgi:hypothetical protein
VRLAYFTFNGSPQDGLGDFIVGDRPAPVGRIHVSLGVELTKGVNQCVAVPNDLNLIGIERLLRESEQQEASASHLGERPHALIERSRSPQGPHRQLKVARLPLTTFSVDVAMVKGQLERLKHEQRGATAGAVKGDGGSLRNVLVGKTAETVEESLRIGRRERAEPYRFRTPVEQASTFRPRCGDHQYAGSFESRECGRENLA